MPRKSAKPTAAPAAPSSQPAAPLVPPPPGTHPRLATLQARRPPRNPAGPFADLPYSQRQAAEQWFWKFCRRWGADLPPWRRAILAGTARRLALHPPTPGFGHRLHGALGGNTTAANCRAAGIPHPRIVAMNQAREWKRAGRPALPARQLPLG